MWPYTSLFSFSFSFIFAANGEILPKAYGRPSRLSFLLSCPPPPSSQYSDMIILGALLTTSSFSHRTRSQAEEADHAQPQHAQPDSVGHHIRPCARYDSWHCLALQLSVFVLLRQCNLSLDGWKGLASNPFHVQEINLRKASVTRPTLQPSPPVSFRACGHEKDPFLRSLSSTSALSGFVLGSCF